MKKPGKLFIEKLWKIATNIAEANGAKAKVVIDTLYPSTVNNQNLTLKMVPVLKEAAFAGKKCA